MSSQVSFKTRANGRIIVSQQLPTLLNVNTCWVRLHTLLQVVGCCCAKFETGQTFQPTTPKNSFVPWSPKRSPAMLDPFAHPVACCCVLLGVVAQSLKPVKLFSQQLRTFLFFRDRRSIAQQCWIRLHSSSNIVRATHAHYTWSTKSCGLYPSRDALQVPTLFEVVTCVRTQL